MERLSEGFFSIPAVGAELPLQRFIQQAVALRHIVVRDLAVLIELQLGKRFLDDEEAVIKGGGAFDRFLVRSARDLVPRHARDKHRTQRHLRIAVKRQVQLAEVFHRVACQAAFKLFAELRPRVREALNHLAGLGVDLNGAAFVPLAVSADALDQTVRRAGDDERVDCMVSIAVRTELSDAPALAQVRRDGSVYRSNSFPALVRWRKFQIIVQIIHKEARHRLCILEIPLNESAAVCVAYLLFEQISALFLIPNGCVDPYDEIVTPFTAQILQRQAVAFFAVFL